MKVGLRQKSPSGEGWEKGPSLPSQPPHLFHFSGSISLPPPPSLSCILALVHAVNAARQADLALALGLFNTGNEASHVTLGREAAEQWNAPVALREGPRVTTRRPRWIHGLAPASFTHALLHRSKPKHLSLTSTSPIAPDPKGCPQECISLPPLQARVTERWRRAAGGEETAVSNHGSSFPLIPCKNTQKRSFGGWGGCRHVSPLLRILPLCWD